MSEAMKSSLELVRQHGVGDLSVALVHDWLTGMRGGEKVLEMLCKRFPEAPLWTLLYVPGTTNRTIENRPIYSSLLKYMPRVQAKYRNYLPLFPLFAELTKAADVDLVISTSHAVAKSMVKRRKSGKPLHICYIHTPMRYAWDLFDDYFGPKRVGYVASLLVFKPIVKMLRLYDVATCPRVDLFIANSTYVAGRVKRIYGRDAEVLPPPVDTERFLSLERIPGDRYLVVSALVPYKRIDHAIRACAINKRKLRIVGKGPELDTLIRLAGTLDVDVEFVGHANDDDLAGFYATARALLFPGVEDFGIVPVEAIACGCPVIAFGAGGILDSMTDDTAVFYNIPTEHCLANAMHVFEKREENFDERELRARALLFSETVFLEGLERILNRVAGLAALPSHSAPVPSSLVA